MAADSFEAFDFGPEYEYSHQAVAENVLWPLVDHIWGDDWREESSDAFDMSFPRQGKFDGRVLDVILGATTEQWEENGVDDCNFGLTLTIEEDIPDSHRQLALSAIKASAADLARMWTSDEDENDGELLLPAGESDDLCLSKVTVYAFDSKDNFSIGLCRSVLGEDFEIKVPLSPAESHGAIIHKLRPHDIELIEAGCRIHRAPAAIMQAMSNIKAQPITAH